MKSVLRRTAVVLTALLLCVVCVFPSVRASAEMEVPSNSGLTGKPYFNIVLFYEQYCEACDYAGKLFDNFTMNEDESITAAYTDYGIVVNTVDCNCVEEGYEDYEAYCELYGLDSEEVGLPVAFVGPYGAYVAGENEISGEIYDCFDTELEKFLADYSANPEAWDVAVNSPEEEEETQTQTVGDGVYEHKVVKLREEPWEGNITKVIFIHTRNCSACAAFEEWLDALPESVTLPDGSESEIVIDAIYIEDEGDLCSAYFDAFNTDSRMAPCVFIGNEYFNQYDDLEEGFLKEAESGDGRYTPELTVSASSGTLEGYTLLSVIGTGIINGLNPCSMSMLLYFISLLLRRREELLKCGFAFIIGKFVTYMLIGTLLFDVFKTIVDELTWIQSVVNVVMALLFVVLGVLYVRDFVQAKNERYDKVKMQLPEGLRKRNESFMKRIDKFEGSSIVWMSVLFGVLISFGEILCVGQLYLATIINVLQSGAETLTALGYFSMYSFAIVLPLIVFVLIVWKGSQIFDISNKMRKYMPVVKLITAIIFIGYAVYLVIRMF